MTLDKNTRLQNRYRILDILGQGGMGSVYRAVDENLKSTVAIKENLFTTEEYVRQFHLEAVILANLRHPNLPHVYDHFTLGDEGQYLVMDFIEGEDLRDRMERTGIVSEDDAVQIGAAICDALAYLHSRQPAIFHRDIKPGNVRITPDGHIFLVDFGLAKVYQSASQATTTGARAMTPGYSPPEQYGTARTDARTDIYSLGATLYAAVSGVIPEDALARAMENAQLTSLRTRNPKISRRFAAAVEKAMSVDPSDRFQTAEEFKKALLSAASKTQRLPGSYVVTPPPASSPSDELSPSKPASDSSAGPIKKPSAQVEEKPFVSPFKKQKERERKRRAAFLRFVIVLLLLFSLAIPFLAPEVVPMEIRKAIPLLAPTATPTATFTPSPIPSATPTFADTPTAIPPTPTLTLTFTPLPILTNDNPVDSTPTATSPVAAPAVTPIGGTGQIAYASNRSGVAQIYLVDLVTEELKQLTDLPEGACQPAWSPDGKRLVFTSPCKGMDETYPNSSLYIINADGGEITPVPTIPGGDFDPAWSPDGKTIAFTSLRTGQMEIFLLNVADLSTAQITSNKIGSESRQPAWSPDGAQIVYAAKRFGVYQIFMMNANGSDQKQIVRSGTSFSDYLPIWSPDGELILFNQRCADKFCLPYPMRISGVDRSAEQGVGLNIKQLPVEDLTYSPDGFWLAFEGEDVGENKDILYMTITGANRTRVTSDKGLDFDPAWRP
ncbi:MAG: hypothetical protein Fur002_05810 [Anaerolineales bacterium]